jgi:hypothetical protein
MLGSAYVPDVRDVPKDHADLGGRPEAARRVRDDLFGLPISQGKTWLSSP